MFEPFRLFICMIDRLLKMSELYILCVLMTDAICLNDAKYFSLKILRFSSSLFSSHLSQGKITRGYL